MSKELEQAAKDYAEINDNSSITNGFSIVKFAAFKAGAEWQKKQKPEWSEDERIRKEILEDIRNVKAVSSEEYRKKADRWIAWLEKQKEQMCKDCPNRKQQFCERNYIKGFNAAIERMEVELQAMRKKYEEEKI